ncbi:MAG: sulfotransferase family 2 domain-containing protein [Candidatus Omnitrophota bacterium]
MRISHRYKFVFIAVPKTASTSMRVALNPFSDLKGEQDGVLKHHVRTRELKSYFAGQGWDWDAYFKFCFVRNPWDRAVSSFFYTLRQADQQKGPQKWQAYARKIKERCDDFEHYVLRYYETGNYLMSPFFADSDGKVLVDFIGRYETLEQDLARICERIGIGPLTLKKLQPSGEPITKPNHEGYRAYYTPAAIEKIRTLHRPDFSYVPYDF